MAERAAAQGCRFTERKGNQLDSKVSILLPPKYYCYGLGVLEDEEALLGHAQGLDSNAALLSERSSLFHRKSGASECKLTTLKSRDPEMGLREGCGVGRP
ncbi:hypothetical protein GCM10010271_71810 [Streptomyces kurssanovii]|nr:hypothetical protein GCM10010271_71810 [Streptomyces kurssanovii]